MSMLNTGSRVARQGDTMTGDLRMESAASHKLGFVPGAGILQLLSEAGRVEINSNGNLSLAFNCRSTSADGSFYRITAGEAGVLQMSKSSLTLMSAVTDLAGTLCLFSTVFSFSVDGTMGEGTVPLSRMRRVEVAASSAAAVTILVSKTQIVTGVNLGTVNAGDRILVNAVVYATKGATAGQTLVAVEKESGTATASAYNGFATIETDRFHSASTMNRFSLFGIFVVSVGGDLSLRVVGDSSGSDSTVTLGNAQIRAIVLNDG